MRLTSPAALPPLLLPPPRHRAVVWSSPTGAAREVLRARRVDWVEPLCATVRAAHSARLAKRGPTASAPSLRRVMADWLRKEGPKLPPVWARPALLGLALKRGVLRVSFEERQQMPAAASGEDSRGRSRWSATVALDTCSLEVARDDPALSVVVLHRAAFDASLALNGTAEAEAAALEEEAADFDAGHALEAANVLGRLGVSQHEGGGGELGAIFDTDADAEAALETADLLDASDVLKELAALRETKGESPAEAHPEAESESQSSEAEGEGEGDVMSEGVMSEAEDIAPFFSYCSVSLNIGPRTHFSVVTH